MKNDPIDKDLLEILCCPACRGDIELRDEEAELHCPACAFTYPIIEGIPVMFPTNVKERMGELFGRYWDSDDRAAEYDQFVEGKESMMDMHNHLGELRGTLEMLGDLTGQRLLDCGCGNGRFFEQYPPELFVIGIDASLNLLRICKQKERCHRLVCCELEHLPFKSDAFDRVLSVRVLQHLQKQREAVFEMGRVLREGGEMVLHLYNQLCTKTIAKQIRMSPTWQPIINAPFAAVFRSVSPFEPWGIPYDNYNNYWEVAAWMRACGVPPQQVRGVGFGPNKWLITNFGIGARLERSAPKLLQAYLRASLWLEEFLGRIWPFSAFMEKFIVRGVRRGRATP